ncbi:MAG: tetraacyldisaccharide 4'-kinase [Planctomycetota bacterium]|jgi:tetraacyldisaccharide 4'-kinase
MSYEQSHRRLISGQSSGPGAFILRGLLRIASVDYSIVVRLRNFLYSKGWFRAHRVDAAVICIGNITVGGTGKTPLVVWLAAQTAPHSKCAILTRGYKSTQDCVDEPVMLAESCPQAQIIVNANRVAGAAEAIDKFGAEVLIMDDGFQHRRLARDLDIVAIDATQPFGYGKMLPAGLLREPVNSLKRAGAVVLTRCDQVADADLDRLEGQVRSVNSKALIARSAHVPLCAKSADEQKTSIEQLKDKRIFAFCGIGNPDAFFDTVRILGAELVGSKVYDDHHHYTDACLGEIRGQAKYLEADLILTTQKDWTKLASEFRSQISDSTSSAPFACLTIEIQFLTGETELKSLIESTLAGRIPRK